jgi:hypothetical protein
MRKHDVNKINLQISSLEVIQWKPDVHYGCLKIKWESDIGFGEYIIRIKEDGKLEGDSETMDSNEDKEFIKKLLELLVDKMEIK